MSGFDQSESFESLLDALEEDIYPAYHESNALRQYEGPFWVVAVGGCSSGPQSQLNGQR